MPSEAIVDLVDALRDAAHDSTASYYHGSGGHDREVREARQALIDAVGRVEHARDRLRTVIAAYQDLATAYRLGRRPKEKTLDIIAAYREAPDGK